MLVVVLCFSVLGVQSAGLFHRVLHVNQEQRLHSYSAFDGIEKAFSADPEKSNRVCKLLDSLLLGSSVISQVSVSHLLSFGYLAHIAVVQASLGFLKLYSYQSQAPPQSDSQR